MNKEMKAGSSAAATAPIADGTVVDALNKEMEAGSSAAGTAPVAGGAGADVQKPLSQWIAENSTEILIVVLFLMATAVLAYCAWKLDQVFPNFSPEKLPVDDGPPLPKDLADAHRDYLSGRATQFGQMGDTFGGMLNPLLSFISIIGLFVTIALAQKQLADARKATTEQNALVQQQIADARQAAFNQAQLIQQQIADAREAAATQADLAQKQLAQAREAAEAQAELVQKQIADARIAAEEQNKWARSAARIAALTAMLDPIYSGGPGHPSAVKRQEIVDLIGRAHAHLHNIDAPDIPLPPVMQGDEDDRQEADATGGPLRS